MKRELEIDKTILSRLQRLPVSKKAEVLDFVEYLTARSERASGRPSIYSYASDLVKKKRLRKLSLKKIETIVYEVRNIKG